MNEMQPATAGFIFATERGSNVKEEPKFMRYVDVDGGVNRVYANSLRVAQNEHDVRLGFGEMIHRGDECLIEERVVVTVTWTELKSMVAFIQRYLDSYEVQNGPIKKPVIVPVDTTPDFPISNGDQSGLPN